MAEFKEEPMGQFAIEKSTQRIINKPFGDPIAQEYLNDSYDILELSFEDWSNWLKCSPYGCAPYLVGDEIEFKELPEFHDELEHLRMEDELEELKRYLFETDYIISKVNEAMVDDDQDLVVSLKEKYKDELAKRKEARSRINELNVLLEKNDG